MKHENNHTCLTGFEKQALVAFGSARNPVDTLEHLQCVASMMPHPVDKKRYLQLVRKLEEEIIPAGEYHSTLHTCAYQWEQENINDLLTYQTTSQDMGIGRPWKHYGKSQLVNEYCCNDPYTSNLRLMFLEGYATWPPFKKLVAEVRAELQSFHDALKDRYVGYDEWLEKHRKIVSKGELVKQQGEDAFRQYRWSLVG